MAAFMSTGRSICFHEPKNTFGSWENFRAYCRALDYDYIGISDTSVAIDPDFKLEDFGYPPVVVISRDIDDTIESFSDFLGLSLSEATDAIVKIWDGLKPYMNQDPLVVSYDALEHTACLKLIWDKCVYPLPFERPRVDIFQKLHINQHIDKSLSVLRQN
jgi:hypothetical protein